MPVYRGYDQAQLDAQYDNLRAVPDHGRWTERWPVASAEARAALGGRLDVPYGPGERERFDIFPAQSSLTGARAPVMIFIHGGYWRSRSKSDFSFIAPAYVREGIAVAMMGYPLAPAASLDEIVESARQGVAWVYRNAASFGGDPARLHVAGYSSGGHLTTMTMSTAWEARGLPADLVKGGCALGGLYDLEPIRLSYLNADLHLDAASVLRNSPLHLVPRRAGPLILAAGGDETDEFRRQQEIYAKAWRGAGLPLAILPLPGRQHYSILDEFADPARPLFQAVRQQILGGV